MEKKDLSATQDLLQATPVGLVNKILTHSFVDGPGNRAVVFLQGCNLRCAFCHNPQTLQLCTNCGMCVVTCPAGALAVQETRVIWDATLCRECDTCIKVCPEYSSPRVRRLSAIGLWEEIAPFKTFLSGVTVSGGEPLLQARFLLSFFTIVKQSSHLTAMIETNAAADSEALEYLLPMLDGALVDLKVFDEEAHRQLTGAGNSMVKENIRFLAAQGKLHAVRQTVIAGINDGLENAQQTGHFLAQIDPEIPLKLLRFRAHGTCGAAQTWRSPDEEVLETLTRAARSKGLKHVDHSL